MCGLKMLPKEPAGWGGEQIPISAIGIMPAILSQGIFELVANSGVENELKRREKRNSRKGRWRRQEGRSFCICRRESVMKFCSRNQHIQIGRKWCYHAEILFQFPALRVVRNRGLTRSCQGQQRVSDSGCAWRCVCCVCLTHTVCIQAVYILLKCVCNKKRTCLKKYVCLFVCF